MSEIDTSAEAGERLADFLEPLDFEKTCTHCCEYRAPQEHIDAAATLRALVAERDMWRAESTKKQAACEQMGRRITALEAERSVLIDVLTSINRETGRARGEQAHRDATRFACVVSAKAIARKNP